MREILCDSCSERLTRTTCYATPAGREVVTQSGLERVEEWIHILPGRVSRIVCEKDFDDYLDIITGNMAKSGQIPRFLKWRVCWAAKRRARSYLAGDTAGKEVRPFRTASVPAAPRIPSEPKKPATPGKLIGWGIAILLIGIPFTGGIIEASIGTLKKDLGPNARYIYTVTAVLGLLCLSIFAAGAYLVYKGIRRHRELEAASAPAVAKPAKAQEKPVIEATKPAEALVVARCPKCGKGGKMPKRDVKVKIRCKRCQTVFSA